MYIVAIINILMYFFGCLTGFLLFQFFDIQFKKNQGIINNNINHKTKKKVLYNYSNPLQPFKNNKNLYEPIKPHSGLKIKEEE